MIEFLLLALGALAVLHDPLAAVGWAAMDRRQAENEEYD